MGADEGLRRRFSRSQQSFAACLLLIAAVLSDQANGCGPDFPNWLLTQGDQAVLVAPEGNFAAELARINLGLSRIRAIPPDLTGDYTSQSVAAELADLRRALKQLGTPSGNVDLICEDHQHQRKLLVEGIEARQSWEVTHPANASAEDSASDGESSSPVFPAVMTAQGLPGEFADYFEGFIAWHNPGVTDKETARAAWERLLSRPDGERRYKSTWAAFMLGKSWEESDPEKAVAYFKRVRELARQGYRDSLGLAAASLGLEARVYLQQTNFEAAIETYLDQMASGDPTATNSLATAAAKALISGPEVLRSLAKNHRAEKVITAYVISRPSESSLYGLKRADQDSGQEESDSPAVSWLKAAEEAEIKDMDSVEALALAAYRANDMDKASRWINRAARSPLAQWLQAKLLLRAGRLQSAAALLAKITQQFPIVHEGTNAPAPADRKDTLTINGDNHSAERQVHGELGVLQLSRGEYIQALDSLLNGGFWMDAAYVAERVLTLDELKKYVDQFWPAATESQIAEEQEKLGGSDVCPAVLREQIRYLLGRRLTRQSYWDQARAYYPTAWLSAFDALMANLHTGWDTTLEPSNRAAALFQAALIARTNGMELIGTEVAPDWHYHLGEFDYGVNSEERSTNNLAVIVRPSKDELERSSQHQPDPDVRFHYRYQAASLAWQAAKLLPDNNDQTAFILWQGGSFLKYRDPQTADFFYKALVRRNRKTALGAEADRQRWFPILDENGKIVPKKSTVEEHLDSLPSDSSEVKPMEEQSASEHSATETTKSLSTTLIQSDAAKGYMYVVRKGDSVASIVQEFVRAGIGTTITDILEANPGLASSRLLIGQKIFVPARDQ